MISRDRVPYLIGNRKVFRLNKENCQRLLHAIVDTNTHVHDSDSTSIRDGELLYGITIGRADAVFSVSVPVGSEARFNEIMGHSVLEPPLELHTN